MILVKYDLFCIIMTRARAMIKHDYVYVFAYMFLHNFFHLLFVVADLLLDKFDEDNVHFMRLRRMYKGM